MLRRALVGIGQGAWSIVKPGIFPALPDTVINRNIDRRVSVYTLGISSAEPAISLAFDFAEPRVGAVQEFLEGVFWLGLPCVVGSLEWI